MAPGQLDFTVAIHLLFLPDPEAWQAICCQGFLVCLPERHKAGGWGNLWSIYSGAGNAEDKRNHDVGQWGETVKGRQHSSELPCLFSFETLKLSKWSVNLKKKTVFLGEDNILKCFNL